MEIWKNNLTKIESLFSQNEMRSWKPSIEIMKKYMELYPNDVELTVRVIYIFHHILVEEKYPEDEFKIMTYLLKKYFDESYHRFSENSEYLFFIGKILYIAEWYFGINDDIKPIEKRLAFHMQAKAFQKEPDNILYKWAYIFSKNEKENAFILCKIILNDDFKYLEWLQEKGFPGKYIIESLQYCLETYRELL